MKPGNPFILWSEGHESQKQCRRGSLHSYECWLFQISVLYDFTQMFYLFGQLVQAKTVMGKSLFVAHLPAYLPRVLCAKVGARNGPEN